MHVAPTKAQPAQHPPSSTRALFEAADPDLWDVMAEALIDQDPWPKEEEEEEAEEEELDPLGGVWMRTYEVVDVRAGEGIRIEECACTAEPTPLYWIADARAADLFRIGDVFAFGWNEEETFVWPPERNARRRERHLRTEPAA